MTSHPETNSGGTLGGSTVMFSHFSWQIDPITIITRPKFSTFQVLGHGAIMNGWPNTFSRMWTMNPRSDSRINEKVDLENLQVTPRVWSILRGFFGWSKAANLTFLMVDSTSIIIFKKNKRQMTKIYGILHNHIMSLVRIYVYTYNCYMQWILSNEANVFLCFCGGIVCVWTSENPRHSMGSHGRQIDPHTLKGKLHIPPFTGSSENQYLQKVFWDGIPVIGNPGHKCS